MAIEKVITIKSTNQKMAKNNNPYLEVVAQDDAKYSIFDQALWNLFAPNLSVKLSLEKKGNFWNVMGAESVKDALEAREAIKEQGDEVAQAPGEAIGMITKEIGDHIRAGTLSTIFGSKIANSLLVWYRGQTLGITRIDFDGKDLPKFK